MRFYLPLFFFPLAWLCAEDNSSVANNSKSALEVKEKVKPEESFIPQFWRFVGNTRFSFDELSEPLKSYLGKPMSFKDLEKVTAKIEEFYQSNGYIARSVIPPQDVTSGIVKIEIIEAKFGEILFDQTGSTSVRKEKILSMMNFGLSSGELYDTDEFNRRLLIADDLPGVSLTGFLQSGKKPSHLDLVLKSSKEPAYIADLAADNANSRSLGPYKVSFSGMLVSPLQYGETIALQTLKSKGSRYGRLSFGFPLGHEGWKMTLSTSRMNYAVIAPEMKSLDIKGGVNDSGVSLRYPVVRNRQGNVYASIGYDHREYLTTVGGVSQKDYQIRNGKIEFSGNFFDKFIKGGANSASFSVTHGKVNGFGVNDNGHTLLNYTLSRQQSVSEKLSLFLSLQGQYGLDITSANAQQLSGLTEQEYLDSAENFTLGGLSGVRAYPSGEASGPQGQKLSFEMRYLMNKSLILTPFYDWGMVEKRDPTSLGPSRYEISGAGLSASWSTPIGFSLQTTYARRIGNNPNQLPTGTDSDGTLTENRLWVVLARTF